MDGVVVAKTVFSKKFLLHIMKTIDYAALCQTTREVGSEAAAVYAVSSVMAAWRAHHDTRTYC